ncbi:uncharacterized protein B0P05DRAFT_641530 [Gilbertella persicaria]|uniref:uncharacterized protein n=1 Tax=Gilbertella persicaria TaxID=101096 RepID=UPI00221E4172|nr:uncharacterized protein B0P05DRAFT_641530 [Gilbertella persicaria]KAI8052609.1 hypothetical protein B0P05DRAFT_641530 [Gilbertella persicaria]
MCSFKVLFAMISVLFFYFVSGFEQWDVKMDCTSSWSYLSVRLERSGIREAVWNSKQHNAESVICSDDQVQFGSRWSETVSRTFLNAVEKSASGHLTIKPIFA